MNDLQTEQLLPGGKWSNDSQAALHIGGLPADTTDVHLYEMFSPFGAIPSKGVRAMHAPDGSCKGVGFVNFLDPAHAEAAAQVLNGRALKNGKTLRVKPKQPKGFAPAAAAPLPMMPGLGGLGGLGL